MVESWNVVTPEFDVTPGTLCSETIGSFFPVDVIMFSVIRFFS